MVAAIIVLFHWEHGLEDWTPVSRRQIVDWLPQSRHLQATGALGNPFYRPDVAGFIKDGWIDGWDDGDVDAPGMVTAKFIERVSNPRGRIWPPVADSMVKSPPAGT